MDKFISYVMDDISGFVIALSGVLCICFLFLSFIYGNPLESGKNLVIAILFDISILFFLIAILYKVLEML